MVVLLPCSCLNVTVHLTGAPRHIDIHSASSDPAWASLISETSWTSITRGVLSIGGVTTQHEELVSVRNAKGWTIYCCVNCGCDVYATLQTDKSFVAINPSLHIWTGRQPQQATTTTQDNTSVNLTRFSPVFHVMVDSDPPPLSEAPTLSGDSRGAEIFTQLQGSVQKYYEEEQKQMTARISAYVEQEEKQLERLRAQALRDRDAIWNRIRTHAYQQQRKRTSSGGMLQITSPQQTFTTTAGEGSNSLSATEISPGIDMQTTPALQNTSDTASVGGQTPPSPLANSSGNKQQTVLAAHRPSAVIVAQTPLGPETEDDRHRVFSFDEEIPAALFQSPALGPQEVAQLNSVIAINLQGDEGGDDDENEDIRGYNGSQASSGATTPIPMEAITLDETNTTGTGRTRRINGRTQPPQPVDEAFAGYSMHGMPERPRMYSASLPVSVPPTPIKRLIQTNTNQQNQQQQQQPQNQLTAQQLLQLTQQSTTQQQQQQQNEFNTTIRLGSDALNQRNDEQQQQPPAPGDMSRSFAVPVSSSRKLRAIYF